MQVQERDPQQVSLDFTRHCIDLQGMQAYGHSVDARKIYDLKISSLEKWIRPV